MAEILSSRPERFDRQYVPPFKCEVCEDEGRVVTFEDARDLLVHDLKCHPDYEPG